MTELEIFKLAFYTLWKCCNTMNTHTDVPDTDTYMEFRIGTESVYVPVTKEELQSVADACNLLDLLYEEA